MQTFTLKPNDLFFMNGSQLNSFLLRAESLNNKVTEAEEIYFNDIMCDTAEKYYNEMYEQVYNELKNLYNKIFSDYLKTKNKRK